ncbi:hypothetical protein ACLBR5_23500 [Escherichia coli]
MADAPRERQCNEQLAARRLERSAGSAVVKCSTMQPYRKGVTAWLSLAKGYVNLKSSVKKTFAISLLRGVGLLGKEDIFRPGRPSGIRSIPDSQLRGLLSCRLSLLSYTGTPTAAGVAQQARAWLTPVPCYNKMPYGMR